MQQKAAERMSWWSCEAKEGKARYVPWPCRRFTMTGGDTVKYVHNEACLTMHFHSNASPPPPVPRPLLHHQAMAIIPAVNAKFMCAGGGKHKMQVLISIHTTPDCLQACLAVLTCPGNGMLSSDCSAVLCGSAVLCCAVALQVMAMIPGFNANFMGAGGDQQSSAMVKRYITIIESMTDKELDSTNIKIFSEQSRILRLARGSGKAGVQPWVLGGLLGLHG